MVRWCVCVQSRLPIYMKRKFEIVNNIVATGQQDQSKHLHKLEASRRVGSRAIAGYDHFRD